MRSNRFLALRALALGALACGLATAVPACTQTPILNTPRAFNRPSRVVLVCFSGDVPTALSDCAPQANGDQPSGHTLVALVPQRTRGEVAAVDLSSNPARVLDSDRRVPGYTFVPVGEVPTAIAVSQSDPKCTWVANEGSRDLSAVETVRFREESLAAGTVGARRRLIEASTGGVDAGVDDAGGAGDAGGGDGGDGSSSPDSGRPHAMELVEHADGSPSELFVTLPADGAIARVVVIQSETECGFDTVEIIPVPTDIPAEPTGAPTDPTLLPPAEQDAATLATCETAGLTPEARSYLGTVPASVPLDAVDPTTLPAPMPFEMVLERPCSEDACDPLAEPTAIWIGDLARPVIHRFDLATRTFSGSIRAPGPVRDVTLTPAVPDTLDPGAPTRRYLYGIDDRDGTVFVIDASTGHVLPVSAEIARRPDRIPFRATARSVEAIYTSPVDDPRRSGDACTQVPLPDPAQLRGVFVAVALSDGTVRIVDVLDRDATCRSGSGDACSSFALNEIMSFVERHRPRIGNRITVPVSLPDAPTATVGGATFRYGDDGVVEMEASAPTFAAVTCPGGLGQVFPSSGDARVCSVADPWAAEPEAWQVHWQGAIPGTASIAGNLAMDGDDFAIDTQLDLCGHGVLSAEDAALTPEGAPEAGYAGDVVAITGVLPDATAQDATCRELVGLDVGTTQRPVLVPIRAITASPSGGHRLLIAPDALVLDRRTPFTIGNVVACFAPSSGSEELLSFDIRVQGAFAVIGSRTGFQHRVVQVDDHCAVDVTQDVRLQGRAFLERPFENERLAFRLSAPMGLPARTEISIAFNVSAAPAQIAVDLGSTGGTTRALTLPGEMLWSPLDDTIYALDEVRRGLVIIRTKPHTSRTSTTGLRIETYVE